MGYRQFRNHQRCVCNTEQGKNEITKICSKSYDCQIRLWFYIVHNNSDITGHNTKTMILSILNSFDKGTNNTQICGIQTIKTYYQK